MQLGSGATRQRLLPYLVLLPLLCALAAVRQVRSGGAPALLAEKNCRHLETMDVSRSSEPACYCYIPDGKIQLKNIWSTIQVSTFWILMSGCWFSSLYFLYTWKEDLKWLWHHCTLYVLGYCLIVGSISFGFCHKHGPLKSEQSMNLLMWTLQFIGLVFIYVGISIPVVAYAVIVTMPCSKILHYPLRVFGYIGRKASRLFTSGKLEVRYLTEEEYREQGEQETLKALEDLRTFCRRPDFPSWVAVVKLQSPQRFAKFVLGLPHVSPEEVATHDEQYGLGGAALEEQLFNPEAEAEPDRQAEPCEVEEDPKEEEQRQNFFSKDVL
uniref:nuclear envelope integral membrane protein 2 isoform X3 n=1 Tax=Podarcis muralis TaxID=64176 RepID=UPI00109F3753|nr:nuclear envelope integral membrane protein 2 isoform X3 [Podarcis muralis]